MIKKFKKTALGLGILLSTVLGNTTYGMENDNLLNNQSQNQNYFEELPMDVQRLIVEKYIPSQYYESVRQVSKKFNNLLNARKVLTFPELKGANNLVERINLRLLENPNTCSVDFSILSNQFGDEELYEIIPSLNKISNLNRLVLGSSNKNTALVLGKIADSVLGRPNKITDLVLGRSNKITDKDIGLICNHLRDLSHLIILGQQRITNTGFSQLSKLTNLRVLNLSNCTLRGDSIKNIAKITNLSALSLKGCKGIAPYSLLEFHNHPTLKKLDATRIKVQRDFMDGFEINDFVDIGWFIVSQICADYMWKTNKYFDFGPTLSYVVSIATFCGLLYAFDFLSISIDYNKSGLYALEKRNPNLQIHY